MNIRDNFDKAKRIGLFDSGLGGLSVLKQLLMLPELNESQRIADLSNKYVPSKEVKTKWDQKEYLYFADTARCPYGGRNQTEIQQFVREIVDWLTTNDVDLVVMACNTSAALVAPALRNEFALPMIDLLHCTGDIVQKNEYKRIGVMSTKATAKTKAFTKAIMEKEPKSEVFEIACPELVPLVESNKTKSKEAVEALTPYIKELIANNVEAIIYGCTHFPFLHESMVRCLTELKAPQVEMLDPAICLSEFLLGTSNSKKQNFQSIEANFSNLNSSCQFVTTGNVESFAAGINNYLGLSFTQVKHVSVGDLALGDSNRSASNVQL